MDEPKLEVETTAGELSTPVLGQKPGFSPSWQEKIAAFALYILAYLYFDIGIGTWQLTVFTLGFIALTELLYWNRPRSRESWVWLGCLTLIFLSIRLDRCNARGTFYPGLFLHIFAVWWVLSRSGRLLEGESGHLLPLDALNGFIVFPFKHFFRRIRTVWHTLTQLGRRGGKPKTETLVWTLAAVLAAVGLFAAAVKLLMAADAGFDALLSDVADFFLIDWDEWDTIQFLFSLPVAAYLFGLIAGTGHEKEETLRERGASVRRWLGGLKKVPNTAFCVLLGAFGLLYLAFFVVQGSYLFGAFTRTLPEGFIVSEYARQGFFELCRVMAVNFALLWLVTRLSVRSVREHKITLGLCLALLAESLLFAVIAISKLALYIDCFGFTPLRLQSCWGVAVLAFGCLCAGYSLLTGKKSFRVWMIFGAVSLSLLCLY